MIRVTSDGGQLTRKVMREGPDLTGLKLLFSISGHLGPRRVSAQQRRDLHYPYLLSLPPQGAQPGQRYRLVGLTRAGQPNEETQELLGSLAGREWVLRRAGWRRPARLCTDLREYERLLWQRLGGEVELELAEA